MYFCISGLNDTPILIIIDWNILNLDDSSVIIVLYVGIVIVTRVVINIYVAGIDVDVYISMAIMA
jgi:hypothetical protein